MTTYLSLDVGGSHMRCALVGEGRVHAAETVALSDPSSFVAQLPSIEAALARVRGGGAPAGLAIAFPALLDPVAGRVLSTPNGKFEDAVGFDFATWGQERLGLPVRLELDARMALFGERHAGAAQGCDDVVMLTIGTGLGTAAIMHGRMVRGRHYQAGCLGGHLSVGADGRACICGGIGCLEAYASTWALGGLAREDAGYGASTLSATAALDFATLLDHAAAGDALAIRLRDSCTGVWATAVINLIHAYDPELVVLGGGVLAAADTIVPAIRAHVERHAWTHWGTPDIRVGTLGADAALLGTAPLWEHA